METHLTSTSQDPAFLIAGCHEPELDGELSQIAAAVAHAAGTPVVVVSLLLDPGRPYCARYETVTDRTTARGNDPALAVCDAIAAGGALIVDDVEQAGALPAAITGVPELRACLGVPVWSSGAAIGALCAIDRQPHAFSAAQRDEIERLADRAGRRAARLAAERRAQSLILVQRVTAPVLVEVRAMMSMVCSDNAMRLGRVADALDAALGGGEGPVTLAQAAAAAESLAYAATGRTGGVRWSLPGGANLAVAPSLAAAVIAAALSAVSMRLWERSNLGGIAAAAEVDGCVASIVLEAGALDASDAATCAAEVIDVLGGDHEVSVTAEGSRVVVRVPRG